MIQFTNEGKVSALTKDDTQIVWLPVTKVMIKQGGEVCVGSWLQRFQSVLRSQERRVNAVHL